MEERVILVDEDGNDVGFEEKLEAHRKAKLHRAFSIFVFNSNGELLLQKRNTAKYHSGGLWANTCCSHPKPGEAVLEAAHRRLKEEMGFDSEMKEAFSFIYKAKFGNGLTEHELDHVVVGRFDGSPNINREEAEDWKWVKPEELQKDIKTNPEKYTAWLQLSIDRVIQHIRNGSS